MKKLLLFCGIPVGLALLYFLIDTSKIVILGSTKQSFDIVYDGTGDDHSYRELGGFSVTRWKYRQWNEEHNFIALNGVIAHDQVNTKVRLGSSSSKGKTLQWYANIGVLQSDSVTIDQKCSVRIEYNIKKRTATLVNTGEVLPYLENHSYIVYLNKNFEVEKFVALDSKKELNEVHPKLIASYKGIVSRREELLK